MRISADPCVRRRFLKAVSPRVSFTFMRLSGPCGMLLGSGQLHTKCVEYSPASAPHPGQRPYKTSAASNTQTRVRPSAKTLVGRVLVALVIPVVETFASIARSRFTQTGCEAGEQQKPSRAPRHPARAVPAGVPGVLRGRTPRPPAAGPADRGAAPRPAGLTGLRRLVRGAGSGWELRAPDPAARPLPEGRRGHR